jgi:hypothetical protein
VLETHRALQIYLLGFSKAYTWIPDGNLPTPDDSHKMSTVEDEVKCAFLGLVVSKGRLASVVKVPLAFIFNLSPVCWSFSCHLEGVFCCCYIQERL